MNECRRCGNCCKNQSVLITFRDIREIHEYYPDLNILNIITIFEVPRDHKYLTCINQNYPKIRIMEHNQMVQGFLGLKFVINKEGNLICPFYNETTSLCNIHLHKPLICRVYPHRLDDSGDVVWNDAKCIEPWNFSNKLKTKEIRFELRCAKESYAIFSREVEKWNKIYEKKNHDEFLKFILEDKNG
ncbi:MAG: hypothetical protein GF364_17185 [Candidatus Lokiarchaeota archaeon]|nr:hypothetical protein [Candidatus Lokiarchaeota archaeon]